MKYLIGIDLGTSATKTVLTDERGRIIASDSCTYGIKQLQNGWAEQNPLDWRKAVLATIKNVAASSDVVPEEILGIGLSGQMHGLVMLDEDYAVIGDSIIWCDQRASAQVRVMEELLSVEKWIAITANPPIAGWTAAKILWVREHRPEDFARCRHILLPKDYIRFELTGVLATDVSDASGMQLLDVKNRTWSYEIMDLLGLERNLFAPVHESIDVIGCLREDIARECGLTTDTAVIAGGSDNACAAVGSGVVREGEAMVSLGTSAVVYTHLDHFTQIPGGGLHTCCCAVPGGWHTMGGPQSAGLSMEWFKNNFCKDAVDEAKAEGKSFFEKMNREIAALPIGSSQLIYLPFLMGERTPHMNPDVRGAFVGLNAIHTKWHMLRAIMEGITFCLADCNNLLKSQGVDVTSLKVCGGGSKNPVWKEMIADLFRCAVHTLEQEEGAAYGAAILAGAGTGVFGSVREACDTLIKRKEVTKYDAVRADRYEKFLAAYDEIYESLLAAYDRLAALRE